MRIEWSKGPCEFPRHAPGFLSRLTHRGQGLCRAWFFQEHSAALFRAQESLRAAEQARAELAHTRGRCLASQVVCGEAGPAVSASQRARWRAGGGVRQRNAPLPMVCNCNRSIVANGLYPHSPDHHSTRPPTSARLPCATLRKSSPPRVGYRSAVGDRSPGFFFAYGKSQHFDLGQEFFNLRSSSCHVPQGSRDPGHANPHDAEASRSHSPIVRCNLAGPS